MNSSRYLHKIITRLGAGVFALAALSVTPLSAMSYVQMKDADLINQSDGALAAIVRGGPRPVLGLGGERIAARYTLDVTDDMGRALPQRVTVEIPGWQGADEAAWQLPGIVSLKSGDSIVLVYARRSDDVLLPLHLNLGVFVEQGGSTEPYLERVLEASLNAAPLAHAQYGAPRDLRRFRAYVRSTLAGIDAPVDYLLPTRVHSKLTSLTGGGRPLRWFEFDQGGTVRWHANADGQHAMVHDGFAQLQSALSAWTDDATSRIQLSYAGTIAPGASDPPTPAGRLSWNDPDHEIPGSFDCAAGGVLAIGGPSLNGSATTYRGVPFQRIRAARIVTQDGAGCYFDRNNGADGAMVLGHEIGHTLGFGHSCGDSHSPACASSTVLDDALMRATMHSDGRGARLGVDDIAAANQWYFSSAGQPSLRPPSAGNPPWTELRRMHKSGLHSLGHRQQRWRTRSSNDSDDGWSSEPHHRTGHSP